MTSFRVVSSVVGPSSTLNKRNSSKVKKREMKIFWSNKLNEIQCNPRDDVVLQFISGTTELERGWNRSVVEKVNDLVATVVFYDIFSFLISSTFHPRTNAPVKGLLCVCSASIQVPGS